MKSGGVAGKLGGLQLMVPPRSDSRTSLTASRAGATEETGHVYTRHYGSKQQGGKIAKGNWKNEEFGIFPGSGHTTGSIGSIATKKARGDIGQVLEGAGDCWFVGVLYAVDWGVVGCTFVVCWSWSCLDLTAVCRAHIPPHPAAGPCHPCAIDHPTPREVQQAYDLSPGDKPSSSTVCEHCPQPVCKYCP